MIPLIIPLQVWYLSTLLFFSLYYLFFSLPEEVVFHISDFLYDLLVPPGFPREELSRLEVIEHDGNKAHLIIWLEHENKKLN